MDWLAPPPYFACGPASVAAEASSIVFLLLLAVLPVVEANAGSVAVPLSIAAPLAVRMAAPAPAAITRDW